MTSNLPDLEIDLETFQIRRGGQSIRLTQTEWDLLRALIEQKNKPVSHKYLLQKVWGDVYGKERNYIHHFIASLRKKLGDNPDNPRYLLTLPKIGYQWVEQEEQPQPAHVKSENRLTWQNVAPIALSSFIGRERELAVLNRKMRKKEVRLLTLTGPGGIGKTRLALELATQLSEARLFTDGLHFIDLAPVDNPDFVISSIAHEFGLREKAGEDPLESLKNYLRSKDLLLILDNFEHVVAAADQVLEILTAARSIKILVTSREKLHLYGEHKFEVQPLSLNASSHSINSDEVCTSEAVLLFVDRAQAIEPYFELTPENAPILQHICERLDGLPLAIELATIVADRFTPAILLDQLNALLHVLVEGQHNLPQRHQTLRAAIDWSHGLLDDGERRLFDRLSVFNGSFTADAARAVCMASPEPETQVEKILTSLRHKSLLNLPAHENQDATRYAMLGAFREYGAEMLTEEDAAALGRRHSEFYLQLLEGHIRELSAHTYKSLTLELGNLRAALRWSIANNASENALRLSIGMYELWQRLGMLREGRQWLFDALDAAEERPTPLRARALFCAGALTDWLGEHQIAQSLYRESLELYELLEDDAGVTSALQVLAAALINQGDFIDGRSLSEQSLRLAREHDSPYAAALALNNLGMIAVYQGDALTARPIYLEMHALFESLNIAQGMAWALTGLSWAALLQGNYLAARNFIDQSLELHRQSSDMLGTALALACDSWIALYRADFDDAASKLQTCLTLCRDLGLVNLSIWPLVGLARIYLHQGERRQAQVLLDEALRLCQQLNFPPITAWVYLALGISQRLEGEFAAAFDDLDRALTLSHKRDDKNALVAALEQFAALFVAQDKPDTAAQLYGAAANLRETHILPLSELDGIEFDLVTRQLQSGMRTDWDTNWHKGRALDWNGILQLIHCRPERLEGF